MSDAAPPPTRTVVRWDIDGTLLDVRGAGRRAFSSALHDAWGVRDDLHHVRFAGATDLGVLAQLRARYALAVEGEPAFFAAMAAHLDTALASEPPHVYEGVHALVASLAARSDVVLGLVTGNAAACASVKLARAGFDVGAFVVGGYGDEHADRDELARRALQRVGRLRDGLAAGGLVHSGARVVLVGDTPSDVRAARAIDALAVAVTTGHHDRAALEGAGADVVVDSLSHLPAAFWSPP
jgi:phosphoglycolate phosphatase